MTEKMTELKEYFKKHYKEETMSKESFYTCLHEFVNKRLKEAETICGNRKLYYISAEFLLGKMLNSNLLHLGLLQEAQSLAEANGFVWEDIQAMELEPSLGNGGLGRLAACFLDSIASLELCGDGIGLYYHFGLFEQQFKNLKQNEVPNQWIQDTSWFHKKKKSYTVTFKNFTLQSVLYDMDVIGKGGKKNTLHLFDVESVDERIINEGISFDKKYIPANLTLFLYPDDSDEDGRKLRIYQQYFMVSCGAQMILEECRDNGYDLEHLDQHVVIQINDTHPTMIIPELIRLLMKEGFSMRKALKIVENTCAYTNHTILAEALETWPKAYLEDVVPQLVEIIEALDAIAAQRDDREETAILDNENRVHMAHIDIHFGKSVNGVAAIHTQILKDTELHSFYEQYPEKFNNKTNGITFTRWLQSANPQLDTFLKELLGEDVYLREDGLKGLLAYRKDEAVLKKLLAIRQVKKHEWVAHMRKKQGVILNEFAVFDTQVKRLHEYKRQQMNALYIIHKYLQIKKGILPPRPIVCIFGAKAAPAYTIAKDIIHALLCLMKVIESDPLVTPYLKLCFIENYNVSEAESVISATDISEQISLASKEASGTGNMKFMLNGAVTIGTRDGANVEIADLVGNDNIYIFGKDSDTVIQHYAKADYNARQIYDKHEDIQILLDFLVSETMCNVGDKESLTRLYNEILNKDWFMTLLDIKSYIECKEQMLVEYEDRNAWAEKMLVNIAMSGFFSSDRTIKEYDRDIWHLS